MPCLWHDPEPEQDPNLVPDRKGPAPQHYVYVLKIVLWMIDIGLLWMILIDIKLLWKIDIGLLWVIDIGLLWMIDIGLIWMIDIGLLLNDRY